MTDLDLFVGQKRYESALPSTSNTHNCNDDIIFAVHQNEVSFVPDSSCIELKTIWVDLLECETFSVLLDLLSLRNLILIGPCWFGGSFGWNLRLSLLLGLGVPAAGNGAISSLHLLLCVCVSLSILPRV
jgi:hypothetical protein